MIFNSVTYLLLLVIAVLLFWRLGYRPRLWMLFLASVCFYGFWRWEFLGVMFASAINDYFCAIAIYKTPLANKRRRKNILILSLVVNLGLLLYFKYLNFFAENANQAFQLLGWQVVIPYYDIILPLGISFYTFQTISYTVDVYRGFEKPTRDFVLYGTYVMFFPQLVAGPILRAGEVIYQLKSKPVFALDHVTEGVKRILFGLCLKTFFADNIASFVDEGFALPASSLTGIDVWCLAILFGFQIYFDFAAYSHIAIGSARLMGIQFPENFNFPYIASSFKDFWKRWHISLSSWIRDYLYLPLMGAKVQDSSEGGLGVSVDTGRSKKNQALFLTWGIMGLWHGANWTFVLWGLYHASFIFIERQLKALYNRKGIKIGAVLGWIVVFPLVMLSWIPFRAGDIGSTMVMFTKVGSPLSYLSYTLKENSFVLAATLVVLFLLNYFIIHRALPQINRFPLLRSIVNVAAYTIIVIIAFTFLRPISQFIYFQF